VIALGGTTIVWAQNAALPASVMSAAPGEVVDPNSVRLLVGRSTVIDVGTPVARVSLTSPDIADAMVTSPNQLLVNGKMPGTISMFVWDRAGALRRYEVVVQRDLARLSEQLRQLFPGETIDAYSNGKNIVLSGSVSNKDVIEKAINVAAGYVDKREEVVPLLQIQSGAASNQVLLRVRFAEVSRNAMSELGASLFTGPGGHKNYVARTNTEQFGNSLPNYDDGKMIFSDYLNLFLFNSKEQIGGVVKALQSHGLFQSLAEPNLVAESGKEASFLAGGEFPVPVAQGSGSNMAVSVVFKEFGIRLNFTPTVIGDRVHLKVRPEVSTLDFGNAVTMNGFRIPALSTRRTETELELQNGQTFAIAGLIDNQVESTLQKIPGLGDIPVLGLLFKSKQAQKHQTELVVMITPEILPNNSKGVTPNLPRTPEPYLPALPDSKTMAAPAPAFSATTPVTPPVVAAVVSPSAPPQTPATPAAAAAAVVANLNTSAPRVAPTTPPKLTVTPPPAPTSTTMSATEARALAPARVSEVAMAAPSVAQLNLSPLPVAVTPVAASAPVSAVASASGLAPASTLTSTAAPTASAIVPVAVAGDPTTTPASGDATPKLSGKERRALAKAKREAEAQAKKQAKLDAQQKAEEEKKQAALDKEQARQAEIERRAAEKEKDRQAKLAKEQAKREAEEAKKADEAAKKQARLDEASRKSLDEAAAQVKAAQEKYNAELNKAQQQ
jgi:pilus assembly protein CpaC